MRWSIPRLRGGSGGCCCVILGNCIITSRCSVGMSNSAVMGPGTVSSDVAATVSSLRMLFPHHQSDGLADGISKTNFSNTQSWRSFDTATHSCSSTIILVLMITSYGMLGMTAASKVISCPIEVPSVARTSRRSLRPCTVRMVANRPVSGSRNRLAIFPSTQGIEAPVSTKTHAFSLGLLCPGAARCQTAVSVGTFFSSLPPFSELPREARGLLENPAVPLRLSRPSGSALDLLFRIRHSVVSD